MIRHRVRLETVPNLLVGYLEVAAESELVANTYLAVVVTVGLEPPLC